jgi:ditrans,polycis-polyprenyl diphosphate synthase
MTEHKEGKLGFFEKIVLNILKLGEIPNHIAFIMDGNRRYAKQNNILTIKGHEEGEKALERCLLWCKYVGVKKASIYAFSIQNFQREESEVKNLMNLIKENINKMLENDRYFG